MLGQPALYNIVSFQPCQILCWPEYDRWRQEIPSKNPKYLPSICQHYDAAIHPIHPLHPLHYPLILLLTIHSLPMFLPGILITT